MGETGVHRNFIDGEWVDGSARRTFENRSPTDRSTIVGRFQDSTTADADAAIDAARRAFRRWRLVPAPKRAEYLFRVGELLTRRKDELARDMALEMGKPVREARGDVQEAIDVCYHVAGE